MRVHWVYQDAKGTRHRTTGLFPFPGAPASGKAPRPARKSKRITSACIGCGVCIGHCPTDAINISGKRFYYDDCIGCNRCMEVCLQKAIVPDGKRFHRV